jgi:hypothetical protein
MKLEVIGNTMWGYVWPVILIILGLWFFTRWRWKRRWWSGWYPGEKKRDHPTRDE